MAERAWIGSRLTANRKCRLDRHFKGGLHAAKRRLACVGRAHLRAQPAEDDVSSARKLDGRRSERLRTLVSHLAPESKGDSECQTRAGPSSSK
jgi:hypothetical protein